MNQGTVNLMAQVEYFMIVLGIILVGLLGLAVMTYLLMQWLRYRSRERGSLGLVTLLVAVPRDNEVKIEAMEQVLASLHSVYKSKWYQRLFGLQPIFSFEIMARKEEIKFYVLAPKKYRDLIEKQIYGAWPGAELKEEKEQNIFSKGGKVAFAAMKLKKPSYQPIRLYKDLPTDSLASLTSALAKMDKGEGAIVQFLVAPAGSSWSKAGESYVSSTKKKEADPEKATHTADTRSLEEISSTSGKAGFQVVVRVVVSSPELSLAKQHVNNIIGTFSQFSSSQNYFTKSKIWIDKCFMVDFLYRYMPIRWLWSKTSILTSEELATVFHFPNKMVETPHIYFLRAKRAPAPSQILNKGLHIGKNKFRGMTRDVYIGEKDRQRHIYIIGKTGVGKSELLTEMIMQDIKDGKGVCFIDPHDTVEKILEMIPPERVEDVIYFNPADLERPLGLNIMEVETEEQKHFVVSSIINLMYKLYDPHKTGIIGPRFEHAIRNAMLTVMYEKGSSFVEVVRVLSDPQYVQELLPKIDDPVVKRYWTDQIAQTSDFHKSEVLDYIVSKFGRFVTDKMMRNIIGQSESSFNFRQAMDEGKILLINLAKGRIGEENSNFLGLILVPKILIAAMSRQDVPEEKRKDFYLYVDEFQNFATPDFAQILSEARKYHLNLIVANQFVGQIEDEVKHAIFGNVGTLMSFRVGVTDANFLQHEFSPVFEEGDLVNVERFNVYMKTTVNNEPVEPFSVDLTKDMSLDVKRRNVQVGEAVRQLSRLKYGKARELVEAEIAKRAKF
jgi:hypothetical protein